MKVKNYDYKGKEKGTVDMALKVDESDIKESLLLQYIRVFRANQRQGTSKAKTRAEVRGGGRKPWRQKGTGRARAGSIRSPIWVGGGAIHGPSPKEWSLKLTKSMRAKVFRDAFALKLLGQDVISFEFPDKDSTLSTKGASEFLKAVDLSGVSSLVIHNNSDNLYKSFRNLKNIEVTDVNELNAFDLTSSEKIIVEKKAVEQILERLKK